MNIEHPLRIVVKRNPDYPEYPWPFTAYSYEYDYDECDYLLRDAADGDTESEARENLS